MVHSNARHERGVNTNLGVWPKLLYEAASPVGSQPHSFPKAPAIAAVIGSDPALYWPMRRSKYVMSLL